MSQNLADLQRFAVAGAVAVVAGDGGLPVVRLATERCRAEIHLHGAHVTRWQPTGHSEVLWLSALSRFAENTPIRGGVPLCWPWFGPHPAESTLPGHGYARVRRWRLESVDVVDGSVSLVLSDGGGPLPGFPHAWQTQVRITVGSTLTIALATTNAGSVPFTISEALHTYLAVSDVRRCRIAGLGGTTVFDKVAKQRGTQAAGDLVLTGWTDQVHLGHDGAVSIADPGWNRRIVVSKTGAQSTVVWNPWVAQAAKMPDFAAAEWPGMLCVEAANCLDDVVTVAPGTTRQLATVIAVEPG